MDFDIAKLKQAATRRLGRQILRLRWSRARRYRSTDEAWQTVCGRNLYCTVITASKGESFGTRTVEGLFGVPRSGDHESDPLAWWSEARSGRNWKIWSVCYDVVCLRSKELFNMLGQDRRWKFGQSSWRLQHKFECTIKKGATVG